MAMRIAADGTIGGTRVAVTRAAIADTSRTWHPQIDEARPAQPLPERLDLRVRRRRRLSGGRVACSQRPQFSSFPMRTSAA